MPRSFDPAFAYRFETVALRIPDSIVLNKFAVLGDSATQEFASGQQTPEVAALGTDPGEGDDVGADDGGGGAHEGGETAATPDPEAGAETGGGEPSASPSETPAETSSSSSSTGTPAQTTLDQPIQWEQNDPALSPPRSTPGSWLDSSMDSLDGGALGLSAAGEAGKPSVGSFLYSMASMTGSALLWVGMAAAVVLLISNPSVEDLGWDSHDDLGGHDGASPDAVASAPPQDESANLIPMLVLPDAAGAMTPHSTVVLHFDSPEAQGAPLALPDQRVFLSPAVRELLGLWPADEGSGIAGHMHAVPGMPETGAAVTDFATTIGVPVTEGLPV